MQLPGHIKQIKKEGYLYRYSVCTLVTRREEYLQMQESFTRFGFDAATCEYLVIDNSEANVMDAYDGVNRFLQTATGEYIIICHQDILLTPTSTRQLLDDRIKEITSIDPAWAVLGNAGAAARLYDRLAIKIAYPDGEIVEKGTLPQLVCSVDENFMVVKNEANLALSRDIGGYHLYGFDICQVARLLGYSAYVIDFLLVHKSRGNADASFDKALDVIKKKYTAFMQGRYMNTNIAKFYLSDSGIKNVFFNTRLVRRVLKTAEQIKHKLSK